MKQIPNRRQFLTAAAVSSLHLLNLTTIAQSSNPDPEFKLRYILGSCLYGYADLDKILPEVRTTKATAVDIWPKVHGNQREQLDEMGESEFQKRLDEYGVTLGCMTQYGLGPFGLQEEMGLAQRLGCRLIVTGAKGPKDLKGTALKAAIAKFIEQMKPHLDIAQATNVSIAIENHGNSLIQSSDSLKWLAELRPNEHLSIALAPYHLPQQPQQIAQLITELGDSIKMFYAWQHGMGCMKKLPKAQELLQMPGRGNLDFEPIIGALKQIRYAGWTEIFMHPFPRGIPILDEVDEVTAEINRARQYLERFLKS